ncbi:MAG: hypothetical protein J1F20_06775 [Muribaculaceae bacterium]|nr:hypothetical protein [Muribaculaceae bacterium]
MKKTLVILTTLCIGFGASARIAEVSTPEPILKGIETDMYHPILSQDGKQLLFADADYSNLRSYDFASGVVSKIKADKNQAYIAHFDKQGVVALTPSTSVRTKGTSLIINTNGVEKTYSPVECHAGYLWESLSPDGTKVMFVAAGKGVYITDLEGNILAHPGKFESPVWFGNDHIVVQKSTDDGHQYNSSQILLLTLDGSEIQPLTKPESMTFSPAASIQSGKVVFTTIDGHLFQMNVKLD